MDTIDSSASFQYGTRAYARYINASSAVTLHGDFVYVKGVANCDAGEWVSLNPDNDTIALLADGHIGGVGVAVSDLVASKSGWVQVTGKASALLAASVADNAGLYTTGTAGTAGATGAGQSEIMGARAAAASGSSAANTDVELWWPNCGLSAAAAG
jgi:hypothetical protein